MAKQLWVIEILSQDRKVRRKRLQAIYQECYPWVELYVQKNNGSQEEAKDIFQDAVACLYQNLRMGKFKGDSSVKTYVHAIAKRLWLSQLRKKKTAREAMVSQVLPVMEAEPEVNADKQSVQQVERETRRFFSCNSSDFNYICSDQDTFFVRLHT